MIYPMAYSQQPVPSEEKAAEEKSAAVTEAKQEPEASKVNAGTTQVQGATVASGTSSSQAAIFQQGPNMYASPKVKFRLYTTDNIFADKIEYRIDNGDVKVFAEPFAIEQEGKHVISYNGIDKIGNREDPKLMRVIIDATAPTIIVTTNRPLMKQGDKVFVSKDFAFKVDTRDDISGVKSVEYSTNGTDFIPYRQPFGIPTDGTVNLKVRATDNVLNANENFVLKVVDQNGNPVDLTQSSLALLTDNVAPKVEIKCDKTFLDKNGVKVVSNDAKYSIVATDEGAGVDKVFMRVDGRGDFIPYTSEMMFLTNGEHSIEAKAVDKSGNISPVSILPVYVDVIPPESRIETITQ
jgi:hypothetical protein